MDDTLFGKVSAPGEHGLGADLDLVETLEGFNETLAGAPGATVSAQGALRPSPEGRKAR
jgi:hypothetical protein